MASYSSEVGSGLGNFASFRKVEWVPLYFRRNELQCDVRRECLPWLPLNMKAVGAFIIRGTARDFVTFTTRFLEL